jgi:mannose-6-phosphate isomerase-like protein (cupin superfamily)
MKLKISKEYSELLDPQLDSPNLKLLRLFRLFCYGFRCGGFVDITKESLINIVELKKSQFTQEFLNVINTIIKYLDQILALRSEAIPKDMYIIRRFFHYQNLFNNILERFEILLKEESFKLIYEKFKISLERVTNCNGLFILDWGDSLITKINTIDLPDQKIKILQGLFTDDFSFNFAIISPGSKFYHDHTELWEYHFIDSYNDRCLYQHIRAGKAFQIKNIDIISMQSGIAHGGYNPQDSIQTVLGFVAGSKRYGPWRFDFNDRGAPPPDFELVNDIKELNGVMLNEFIEQLQFVNDSKSLLVEFPRNECEVRLELVKVGESGYKRNSKKDEVYKVISGTGEIIIEGSISNQLKPQYSFVIPCNINYNISSNNMVLMKFS